MCPSRNWNPRLTGSRRATWQPFSQISSSTCVAGVHFAGPAAVACTGVFATGGFLEEQSPGRWRLTGEGLRSLRGCSTLTERRRVFDPPAADGVLEDMTTFELVESMKAQGWTWAHWVPPSARRRKHLALPAGCFQGHVCSRKSGNRSPSCCRQQSLNGQSICFTSLLLDRSLSIQWP